jgi:WD40 repeat protein
MFRSRFIKSILLIVSSLLLIFCAIPAFSSNEEAEVEPTIGGDSQVSEESILPTETLLPSETPLPSETLQPTDTPEPTLTPTPEVQAITSENADQITQFYNFEVPSAVYALAWSPDGSLLAAGYGDGSIEIWDISAQETVFSLEGQPDGISNLSWLPDGMLLASSSYESDGSIWVWDIESGQRIQTLPGFGGVAWSPDGAYLAAGAAGNDVNDVVIYDYEAYPNGVRYLSGHSDGVLCVAWSQDGRLLASGGRDTNMIIWDLETEEMVIEISKPSKVVSDVAWSKNDVVIGSSTDGYVYAWNEGLGDELLSMPTGSGYVSGVEWSPDGTLFATAGLTRSAQVWDYENGTELWYLEGLTGFTFAVSFSPDASLLAVGIDQGMMKNGLLFIFGVP